MIKYLELALSQEVYEYLEELDEMNWSARGINVLNQYLRNTSIETTVNSYGKSYRNFVLHIPIGFLIGNSTPIEIPIGFQTSCRYSSP